MGELELLRIEQRIDQYPPQARADILALTRELRRLFAAAGHSQPTQPVSPLYDSATGLLNGGAYGVRFAAARARATRYKKIFAVMSIEVEALSAAGDEREQTIKGVAGRLDSCVRATDTLARIAEGSFAIILEDLTQADHAERVKQTVQDALAVPMQIVGREVVPPTRVTLRFYPESERGGAVH